MRIRRLQISDLEPTAESSCAACTLGRASGSQPCPFQDVERRAGTLLIRAGETPVCVWYIRRGTLLLSSSNGTEGDEAQCAAVRGPGALIGLEALRGAPAGYRAWALSDVALCRLDRDSFRSWVGDAHTPGTAIAGLALDEAERWRRERVAISGRATERVARFLLQRAQLEGIDRPLPVQQQLLARMLGMTPETMSRALARLRTAGALSPGRRVRILDVAALARAADEPAR